PDDQVAVSWPVVAPPVWLLTKCQVPPNEPQDCPLRLPSCAAPTVCEAPKAATAANASHSDLFMCVSSISIDIGSQRPCPACSGDPFLGTTSGGINCSVSTMSASLRDRHSTKVEGPRSRGRVSSAVVQRRGRMPQHDEAAPAHAQLGEDALQV